MPNWDHVGEMSEPAEPLGEGSEGEAEVSEPPLDGSMPGGKVQPSGGRAPPRPTLDSICVYILFTSWA